LPLKKSAFIAIIGRPSAGKSTLLNAFCDAKVSIVSPVPQTTRNSIRGIVNREAGQLVFVDTPGVHISQKKLNQKLKAAGLRAAKDCDLVLYLLDATRPPGEEEAVIADIILALPRQTLAEKTIAVINKIDSPEADAALCEQFLQEKFTGLPVFIISALKKRGLDDVLDCLYHRAPEGPQYYDDDCYTDQDVRFRIAEIVREKCMLYLHEEVPHSIYVDIEDISLQTPEGGDDEHKTLFAMTVIWVERESQKGIVIGNGGSMLKRIRIAALKDLKQLFDWKIHLDIRVKTAPDWRRNDKILKRFV
jgi:GTP-binding protein Era